MQASPHMLTACADTSRENGDGARKRGSVVAILGPNVPLLGTVSSGSGITNTPPREQLVAPGTADRGRRYDGSVAEGTPGAPSPRAPDPGAPNPGMPKTGMTDPTPTGTDDDLASTRDPSRFLNRELSWLDFNARVLALAEDPTLPLLERAKFLAIFSQNLDEFFQVRVAGPQGAGRRPASAPRRPTASTRSSSCAPIRARVDELVRPPGGDLHARRSRPRSRTPASRFVELGRPRPPTTAPSSTRCSRTASSRCSRRSPSTRRTRSPTSRTCRSTSRSWSAIPTTGESRFARVKVPPLLPRFVVAARRRALRAARAGDRRPPRPRSSRAWTSLDHHAVPGHPRRRLRRSRTRSRGPARGDRDRLHRRTKFGRAVRLEVDTDDDPRGPRAALPRARARRPTTSTVSTARSTSAGCGRSTRSTAPT